MKIKSDFITNSSSTNFIIATKVNLTEKAFFDLIGIKNESPLKDIFSELYDYLMSDLENYEGSAYKLRVEENYRPIDEKINKFREEGRLIFTGRLSSDENPIEQFFCMESFEIENENIYFNYLECLW